MKLQKILNDDSQPLHDIFTHAKFSRSGTVLLPLAGTNKHKFSFVPQAFKMYYSDFKR